MKQTPPPADRAREDFDSLTEGDKREMADYLTRHFDEIDTNGDGVLSPEELDRHLDEAESPDSDATADLETTRKLRAFCRKIANLHDDEWELFGERNITRQDIEELRRHGNR